MSLSLCRPHPAPHHHRRWFRHRSMPIYAGIADTQVHHINGAGEDAGVVYSEMQGRENQSGDLMALE